MLNTQPWKLAAIGSMTIVGGAALISAEWSAEQLAACLTLFFAARGTAHMVSSPGWVGLSGAMAALLGGGEIAVGLALLAWPDPSRVVVAAVAGAWLLLYGIVAATIAVTTRAEEPHWLVPLAAALINVAFGMTLVAERGGTLRATTIVLAMLAVIEGAFEIAVAAARGHAARHRLKPANTPATDISVGVFGAQNLTERS